MAFDALSLAGVPFTKMTGSGNDFVFFDGRLVNADLLAKPEVISAICNRHNGIGADGIVILEPRVGSADARIHYFNSDGSPADLCGNATLCSTRLAVELGMASGAGVRLETPAGTIEATLATGDPEFGLGLAELRALDGSIELAAGEKRIGFVMAGIPHLVVHAEDVEKVPLPSRGPVLRNHAAVGEAGANVNWVSRDQGGRWRYRTFERGVEGETLACGTGAIATGVQLIEWGLASSPVSLWTSSGKPVVVTATLVAPGRFECFLRGEGRVVFHGRIDQLG